MRIDIRVEPQYDGTYQAIDDLTYDVDCDQDGYFSDSPTGWGRTPFQAAFDLLEQMEDEAQSEAQKQAARLREEGRAAPGSD